MSTPQQREDEHLSGELGRVLWSDPSTGFSIARLRMDDERVWVIKGDLGGLSTGERVEVRGRFVEDSRWGRQFKVHTARPVLPTTPEGIGRYLNGIGVRGIGQRTAERIVETLGERTLEIIADEPKRLEEVKGLGPKRRQALIEAIGPRLQRDAALLYLHGLALSPWQIRRVLQTWGEDAVRHIRQNPYRLAEVSGLGFATADRVARGLGIGEEAAERIDAGLLHAMGALAQRGHTAPHCEQVDGLAMQVLHGDALLVADRRQALIRTGALVSLDERVATARMDREERELAAALLILSESAGAPLSSGERSARLDLAESSLGFPLEGEQRAAVEAALSGGLLVVTGGPGTGKTTLIQGVLAASAPDELRIALAAPTGRAARRLSEATGREALTVHRMLEVDPHTMRFTRDRERPLEADLVIIDESSMLDVRLARSLCEAVPPGGRLLLVGDIDQLPSVGPGAMLQNLIDSERCPVVRLEAVHRQAARSSIVTNAHRVRRGLMPVSDAADADGDFFLVPRSDAQSIVRTVVEVVRNRLPQRYGFDPIDDIQVLVPVHRGAVGTEALNAALRDALAADGAMMTEELREGEKVIQLRNNYDLEVFNGDIGRVVGRIAATTNTTQPSVEGHSARSGGVRVRFGDRSVDVPTDAITDIRPAYAITVHKSQGSEYEAVVLVLHPHHHLLLQRNLVYTALTRARRFCVVIGSMEALDRAVRNARPQQRQTQLRELLCAKERS